MIFIWVSQYDYCFFTDLPLYIWVQVKLLRPPQEFSSQGLRASVNSQDGLLPKAFLPSATVLKVEFEQSCLL